MGDLDQETIDKYKWHTMKVEEVTQILQTDNQGLSDEEAKRRLEEFGHNELREEKRITPVGIFLNQFKSILIIILIIAAFVSGYVDVYIENEMPIDMFVIAFIVIMNAIIGFIQEYRAEKAVEALKRMVAAMTRVIRDGADKLIPSKELVPGDLILIEEGTRIPADARIIETVSLNVDEASLTGESVPVTKDTDALHEDLPVADRSNMAFMGTNATYGRGKALVIATGMKTEFGKIAESLQAVEVEDPPLKRKVEHMGRQLGLISIGFCIWIFVVGILFGIDLIFMFMTAISMAVSAIPEGLPAVITVTLAWGVSTMARERAIVRKLTSVDTLGCTTIICSDKTGTLTRNEIAVRKLYANGQIINITGVGHEPEGKFLINGVELDSLDDSFITLLRIGTLCNNASLVPNDKGWQMLGDPTEGALVVAAAKAGIWRKKIETQYPRVAEIPFSSIRKRMSTIHTTSEGKRFAFVKGAPEITLELCDRVYENNRVRRLKQEDRDKILGLTQEMAGEGLRLLAMAYKEIPYKSRDFEPQRIESQLVFVGLAGMIDPPREEVREAIKFCKQAGIDSVMITGDHKLTAVAIAKQIGLLEGEVDSKAITGVELDKLSDEELENIVDNTVVYARVSPQHKMRIAMALKKKGHIVAMTGDGVNDAPAIKAADIGVAMGIKGTDVTKEASDMILEDDNFATIVKAIEGGRHIFDNIKKYLRLLISTNFDEFFEITFSSLAGLPLTLIPIQILWINLVTDGLPAVALSMDPKDPNIMQRHPRDPKEGFLRPMWRFIIFVAIVDFITDVIPFLVILTKGFTYWGPWEATNPLLLLARGQNFTSLAFFEIFLAYSCRSEEHSIIGQGWKGLTSNKMLLYAMIGSFITQLIILYTPLATVFHVAPLPPFWLAMAIVNSLSALLIFPQKLLGKEVRTKDVVCLGFFVAGCNLMVIGPIIEHAFSFIFWIGLIIALLFAREIYI